MVHVDGIRYVVRACLKNKHYLLRDTSAVVQVELREHSWQHLRIPVQELDIIKRVRERVSIDATIKSIIHTP